MFDDELRVYLEEVERGVAPPTARHRTVDPERLRKHLIRRLRGSSPAGATRHHAVWSDQLVSLARFVGFDVVLLDQRLKGSGGGDSGLELIQRIAELAPFSKTILVTGYAAPEAVERAFALGAYDYLEKGNIFEALLKAKVRNGIEVARETRRAGLSDVAAAGELAALWTAARSEQDRNRKGVLLEELVKLLFQLTPGFQHVRTRVKSGFEEIDIAVENRSDDPMWMKDGGQFLAGECKNWTSPAGPDELVIFRNKLERRYQRVRTGQGGGAA